MMIRFFLVFSLFVGSAMAAVQDYITEAQFNSMFPNRSAGACSADGANTTYTYANFIAAAAWFPDFANVGTSDDRKREIAAFLGQTSHETTGGGGDWCGGVADPNSSCFDWGYCYTEEVGCDDGTCTGYNAANATYPAQAGHSYHGRGAIQLSWNYNYGPVSEQLTGDKMYLLNNPDLVKNSDWAFKTAIWYWMDNTSSRPSPHRIITGDATGDTRGNTYGGVTNAINGGLECTSSEQSKLNKQHDRVNFFKNFAAILGISAKPAGSALSDEAYFYCTTQPNFGSTPWLGQDQATNICINGVCDGSSSSSSSSSTATSSSSVVSSSSVASSSSSAGGTCQRTSVSGYNFNLASNSTSVAGYQQNNYVSQGGPFSPGDEVVPTGMDCNLAKTLDVASDTWNLYLTSAWTGANQTNVTLEKITWVAASSSSAVSSSSVVSSSSAVSSSSIISSSSAAGTCYTAWDSNISHTTGDTFSYNGKNWETCQWQAAGQNPSNGLTTGAVCGWDAAQGASVIWKDLGACGAISSSSVVSSSSSMPVLTTTIDTTHFYGYTIENQIDSTVQGNLDTVVVSISDSIAIDTVIVTQDSLSDGVSYWTQIDTTVILDTINIWNDTLTLVYQPTLTYTIDTTNANGFTLINTVDSVLDAQDTLEITRSDSVAIDSLFIQQDSLSDGVSYWTQVDTTVILDTINLVLDTVRLVYQPILSFTIDSNLIHNDSLIITIDTIVPVTDTLVITTKDSVSIDTLIITQDSLSDNVSFWNQTDTIVTVDTVNISIDTTSIAYIPTITYTIDTTHSLGYSYLNSIDSVLNGQDTLVISQQDSIAIDSSFIQQDSLSDGSSFWSQTDTLIVQDTITIWLDTLVLTYQPTLTYTIDSVFVHADSFIIKIDTIVPSIDTLVVTTKDSVSIDTLIITQDSLSDNVSFWNQTDTIVTVDTVNISIDTTSIAYIPTITYTIDTTHSLGYSYLYSIDSVLNGQDTLVISQQDSIAIDSSFIQQDSLSDGSSFWSQTDTLIVQDTITIWLDTLVLTYQPTLTYTIDSVFVHADSFIIKIDTIVPSIDTLVVTTKDSVSIDTLIITQDSLSDNVSFWNQTDTIVTVDTVQISKDTISINYQPTITYQIDSTTTQGYQIQVVVDSTVDVNLDTLVVTQTDSIVFDTLIVQQDSLADGISFWSQLDTITNQIVIPVSSQQITLPYQDQTVDLVQNFNAAKIIYSSNVITVADEIVRNIQIFDSMGKLVNSNQFKSQYDLNFLTRGNYFIRVYGETVSDVQIRKISVQ